MKKNSFKYFAFFSFFSLAVQAHVPEDGEECGHSGHNVASNSEFNSDNPFLEEKDHQSRSYYYWLDEQIIKAVGASVTLAGAAYCLDLYVLKNLPQWRDEVRRYFFLAVGGLAVGSQFLLHHPKLLCLIKNWLSPQHGCNGNCCSS